MRGLHAEDVSPDLDLYDVLRLTDPPIQPPTVTARFDFSIFRDLTAASMLT